MAKIMLHELKISRLSVALAAVLCCAFQADAAQIQDLVRIKGAEASKLIGTGLVVGLPGTGDGKSDSVMRQVTELIKLTGDPNAVASEMKNLKNVAIVALTATVPDTGVREGDVLDVHVSSLAGAKGLAGGRLFLVPMLGPVKGMGIFAYAEGPITIQDDQNSTVGIVKGGAQMVKDVRSQCVRNGQVTLVLDQPIANWPMATELASLINSVMAPEGPALAKAVDQKNVVIDLPEYELADPSTFITTVLTSYVDSAMINTGAVVVVNEKAQTIVVGADVEISPVLLRVEGLTITTVVTPADDAAQDAQTPQRPEKQPFVKIDPRKRGGAKLSDLLAALNQLKVDTTACINVIREINKSGKLHARLIEE